VRFAAVTSANRGASPISGGYQRGNRSVKYAPKPRSGGTGMDIKHFQTCAGSWSTVVPDYVMGTWVSYWSRNS